MRTLLISICLMCSHILLAQQNGEIKGTVVDAAKNPVAKATVSLVSERDSTVLSYSLTDDKGQFRLVKIPVGRALSLHVTHVGSTPFVRSFELAPNEVLVLDTLMLSDLSLEEVVVTYVPPIRMNGDTLEYKADYFKTRPNASVEELLQLLPGLQVNVDGTIYYQGRQVSAVRVNNKDFFAQDLTLATRNLDASLVDVVQVIKDRGDSKREVLDDTELPIVLNLKTKKEFVRADFGKFYGSGGTRDRYEAGALVNTFRDTLQISFIGFANNLNREGFDYSEMRQHGGLGRAENNNFYYYGYGGIQTKWSGAVNANYDIGKKLKTNLMYSFEKQDNVVGNEGTSSSFYEAVTEFGDNNSSSTYGNHRHRVRAFARWNPDTTSMLSFDANMEMVANDNDFLNAYRRMRDDSLMVQETESNNSSSGNSRNYGHSFQAEKKFTRSKMLLSLRHTLNSRNAGNGHFSDSRNRFYLFGDSLVAQAIRGRNDNNSFTANNTLNLQVPIAEKMHWDVYARYEFQFLREMEDIASRINADEFTDRNDVANNKQGRFGFAVGGARFNASFFKEKLRVTAGLEWMQLRRDYHFFGQVADLVDASRYWLPNASVAYQGLSLRYAKRASLPAFHQIVVVDSDLYPTSTTFASPYFANQMEDNWVLQYNKWFSNANVSLNAMVNYTAYDRSIAMRRTYDVATSESTNDRYEAPGIDRWYSYFSLMKRFPKWENWNVSWNVSGNVSLYESYQHVNGAENLVSQSNGSVNTSLQLGYKNKVTFIPSYGVRLNRTRNRYVNENFRDMENFMHDVGGVFRLEGIRHFRLETSYTIRNQAQNIQNERINLHLVNASLYYPVLRGRGELKLTAFDILNQNQEVYVGGSGNSTYYQEQLTLRQYFLLGLVYKFTATPSK